MSGVGWGQGRRRSRSRSRRRRGKEGKEERGEEEGSRTELDLEGRQPNWKGEKMEGGKEEEVETRND